jgi:hypothetical protein
VGVLCARSWTKYGLGRRAGNSAFLYAATLTPFGKFNGALADIGPTIRPLP